MVKPQSLLRRKVFHTPSEHQFQQEENKINLKEPLQVKGFFLIFKVYL
jgi:hypothetical protein